MIALILVLISFAFLYLKIENDKKSIEIQKENRKYFSKDSDSVPYQSSGAGMSIIYMSLFFIFLMFADFSMVLSVQNIVMPNANSITTPVVSQAAYTAINSDTFDYIMLILIVIYILSIAYYIVVVYINKMAMKNKEQEL